MMDESHSLILSHSSNLIIGKTTTHENEFFLMALSIFYK